MKDTDIDRLSAAVRDVIDFPKEGIVFKDIAPVLADGALFRLAIDGLVESIGGTPVDKIVGIDARGFIFGAAVADRIGAGLVPVRKKGKLPWRTRSVSYALEYGESVIEIHEDAISPGERVLLVDDLLATGGTSAAALQLVRELGGEIVGASFFIELAFLDGRKAIHEAADGFPISALLTY
ncbi:MAG: adenine phosphoribosyltransferase [Verrucomicrobiales bacterium]|nr:adenine phosphoribosyltransferase [Verrucomicrobiales bacterium]